MSFTKYADIETDWQCGAKNVQIKLPTSLVRSGKGFFQRDSEMKTKILSLMFCCFFLGGCIDYQAKVSKRRHTYVDSHPDLPVQIRRTILNGQLALGMTREEVNASYGFPNSIDKGDYIVDADEQRIYRIYTTSALLRLLRLPLKKT